MSKIMTNLQALGRDMAHTKSMRCALEYDHQHDEGTIHDEGRCGF